MDRLIATLTNLSYVYAGIYCISMGVPTVGTFSIALGFLSGVHHWYLQKWSRLLDYIGMYLVSLSLVAYIWGIPDLYTWIGVPVISGALAWLVGSSRAAVGGLFGAVLVSLHILLEPMIAMLLTVGAALAFSMNQLGDTKLLKKHHGILHGQIWHVVTGFLIMAIVFFIA